MRHAGIAGQQQALGGTDTQANTGVIPLDAWPLAMVIGQLAGTVRQAHFTQHPTLAQQRAFQLTQVRLHLALGGQVLHQHFEHATTGQADTRTRVAVVTVAHDGNRLRELTQGHTLEEVVFDAATRQRPQPLAAGIDYQQRARRAGRRAVGGEHRAQPNPLTVARPLQGLTDHL